VRGIHSKKEKRKKSSKRKKDREIEREKTALHNSKGRTRNLSSTNIYTIYVGTCVRGGEVE
jgi:hypothetical protein